MTMQRKPLSAALGLEIRSLDLKALDDELASELRLLLRKHLLLAIRDQKLDPAALVALASRLGEPEPADPATALAGHPYVREIRKEPEERENFGGFWHSDGTTREMPPRFIVLQAISVPSVGGNTLFANQMRAYENLPPDLRRRIDPLYGIHAPPRSDVPIATRHRLVWTMPDTGRRHLFVTRTHMVRIEGLPPPESDALKSRLCDETVRAEHQAALTWYPGTVALWDNRAVQHYAPNDYDGHRRVMHRVLVN